MVASSLSLKPHQANAQLGSIAGGVAGGALGGCGSALTSMLGLGGGGGSSGGGGGGMTGNAVPVTNSTIEQNTTKLQSAKCTWDGVAWQLARVALHSLTQSVVSWVNSGFNGSPAFLTNPEAFFLDTADQMTGAFLAGTGPLRNLCSPFSLDIHLALALNQTQRLDQRYTCTLSTIVKNVKGTIDGFAGGDFSQGGWPAFLSISTQPQNNAYGAYLSAHSNLLAAIGAKQGTISTDLLQGHGFMSWKDCTNVPVSGSADSSVDPAGELSSGDSSKPATKQVCTTETPGSTISGALDKQLGVGSDELNLTNSVNEIVSAVFSQLLSNVLKKGLASGHTQTYVNGISTDPALKTNFTKLRNQAANDAKQAAASIVKALDLRNQAVTVVGNVLVGYTSTQTCLASLITAASTSPSTASSLPYLQSQMTSMNAMMASSSATISRYQNLVDLATSAETKAQGYIDEINNTTTAQQLSDLNDQTTFALTDDESTSVDLTSARGDLTDATALATAMKKALTSYQTTCKSGGTISLSH